MGGLFKKPKAPPPDPKIEENLREQEVQAEKREIEEQKRISAQFKNRIKVVEDCLWLKALHLGKQVEIPLRLKKTWQVLWVATRPSFHEKIYPKP